MLLRLPLLAGAAALLFVCPASAQEPTGEERRVFTPADFTQYAPRTALDMVSQIPGFSIDSGGSRRGLGQADTNVLINGERISGKSNGPVEALGRISAGDVVRLEIVDGASLDIPGLSGQVLNAVVRVGAVSGQFRYSPRIRTKGAAPQWGTGEVSVSGGGDSTSWTLSFENDQFRGGNFGPEIVTDGVGTRIDTREEAGRFYGDRPTLSGSLGYTAANENILNLTGEVGAFIFRIREESLRSGVADTDRVRRFRRAEDEFDYELGGDYELALFGGRLRLIGLRSFENSPVITTVDTEFSDERPLVGSSFARQANEAETIARSEYRWNMLGGDWQASAEGAKNILDIESSFEERDETGALQPIPFPGASARVEEDRAEVGLSYGRPLSQRVTAQGSLGAEYSRISQSGPLGKTRSFYRPKGFVSLDWNVSPDLDLSAKLERLVGQLDFFDFIASVDIGNEQIDVVNADLVPPQSWLLEVEGTRSLGTLGSLNVRVFGQQISDIVDQIPIEGGGEAPGNVASAERYGLEAELTFLSEPLGWPGGRLDLDIEYQESSVEDPLLGTLRPISGDDQVDVELNLRQDLQGTDWAFGGFLEYEQAAPFTRLSSIEREEKGFAFAEAFIENKNVLGLTVRGTVANLFNQDENFTRTVFLDRETGEDRLRGTPLSQVRHDLPADHRGKFLRLPLGRERLAGRELPTRIAVPARDRRHCDSRALPRSPACPLR